MLGEHGTDEEKQQKKYNRKREIVFGGKFFNFPNFLSRPEKRLILVLSVGSVRLCGIDGSNRFRFWWPPKTAGPKRVMVGGDPQQMCASCTGAENMVAPALSTAR